MSYSFTTDIVDVSTDPAGVIIDTFLASSADGQRGNGTRNALDEQGVVADQRHDAALHVQGVLAKHGPDGHRPGGGEGVLQGGDGGG